VSFPPVGQTGVIAGWGAPSFGGIRPDLLNNAGINIYSETNCTQLGYNSDYGTNYTSQFCAGN
jgi:hypothetical protein